MFVYFLCVLVCALLSRWSTFIYAFSVVYIFPFLLCGLMRFDNLFKYHLPSSIWLMSLIFSFLYCNCLWHTSVLACRDVSRVIILTGTQFWLSIWSVICYLLCLFFSICFITSVLSHLAHVLICGKLGEPQPRKLAGPLCPEGASKI